MKLNIFGDSIAKGVGVEPGSGWADLIAKDGLEVSNFAEDGERVEGTLEKISKLSDIKLSGTGEIAIIATGTNDCGLITDQTGEVFAKPDIADFSSNFEELLRLAKLKFAKTVVLGLIPSNGTLMPLGEDGLVSYDNLIIEEFNNVLKDLCAKMDTPFADLLPHFLGNQKEFLADHIHPNANGHQIILSLLNDKLCAS